MNQNAIVQEQCVKETLNEQKQKTTTTLTPQHTSTSLPTTTRTESADGGSEQQEHYRNVTTKVIQQQTQPLNKFGLNIKKVSGKAQSSGKKKYLF